MLNWQKAVNKSAYELASKNSNLLANLLYNRGKLKSLAEEKACETYIFKKKAGSRSVKLEGENKPKRMKYNQEDQHELVKKQITTKQNVVNKASSLKQYELCDKTQEEMRNSKKSSRYFR